MSIQIASKLLKQEESATWPMKPRQWPGLLLAGTSGTLLGLSAPGLEQWYLPWFILTGLLALIASSLGPRQAAVRGLAFGLTYNLVYLQWYLSFRPAFCEGNFAFCPPIINLSFWLIISTWQGLYTGIFAFLLRKLPCTAGFLPKRKEGHWHLPSFFLVPLLWVLVDKIGNSKILLGVPWASLEYSQYQQITFIQSAALIGGIGLSACLLLFNTWLLAILAHGKKNFSAFTFSTKKELLCQSAVVGILFLALFLYGHQRLNEKKQPKQKLTVAAIQASLSSKLHHVPFQQVVERNLQLANASPSNSLCVWPEWSLPINFSLFLKDQQHVAAIASGKNQCWITGVFDTDAYGHNYNAVCAFNEKGSTLNEVYHKRNLVPIGEFTPTWLKKTFLSSILYYQGKRFHDTTSGERQVNFKVKNTVVAPLLCFENLFPILSAEGIRQGGQLLVDCSDTSWFYKSILSDQMVAFCVLRAAENHRSFVFSTMLGPSTIIDSNGRILSQAPREQPASISAEVPLENDLTPFTKWCF